MRLMHFQKSSQDSGEKKLSITRTRSKKPLLIIGGIIVLILGAGLGAGYGWYTLSLRALNSADGKRYHVVVDEGMTVVDVASRLKQHNLIKDERAFRLYAELKGVKDRLQAGSYRFSPAQTTPQIVDDLVSGNTDSFNMTIPPGTTLKEIKRIMITAGFEDQEIEEALSADYPESKVFAAKPKGVSLEGYIYPETYRVDGDTTAKQIIANSLEVFDQKLAETDIEAKLAEEHLSLNDGIILASITAKESGNPVDQKQIAQVFLKRLKNDIELGSDITFQYGADLMGVPAVPSLNSPYNTRIHTGLPPGPVGNFDISVLEAIANPASGDYLYFVAGDDGTTHFSNTLIEHEENTAKYCTTLCR